MGFLDGLGSILSNPTVEKYGPTFLSAGLQTLGSVYQGNQQRQATEDTNEVARERLGFDREALGIDEKLKREQLMLQAQQLAQNEQLARMRAIQDAYQTLIEAGLAGGTQQISAIGNLTSAAQAPLLRGRGI